MGSGLPSKWMLPIHPKLQSYCQPEGWISIACLVVLPFRSESRQLMLLFSHCLTLPSGNKRGCGS